MGNLSRDEIIETINTLASTDRNKARTLGQEYLADVTNTDYVFKIELLVTLSNIESTQGNHKQALTHTLDALYLAQDNHDDNQLPRIYANLGRSYGNLDNLSVAMDYYRQMLDISRDLGDLNSEALAQMRIGIIYSQMGQYESALRQYELAMPIYEQLQEPLRIGILLFNSSEEYIALHQYEQALDVLVKAQEIFEEQQSVPLLVLVSLNRGKSYHGLGLLKKATNILETGIERCRDHDLPQHLKISLHEMGRILISDGKLQRAITTLQEALELAINSDSFSTQYELHRDLSEAYKRLEDFEKAYTHLSKSYELFEQVHNQSQQEKLQNLMVLHETAEAKYEARQQERSAEYLKSLNDMKDDAIHTLSHDLKNPLSTILLLIDLLKNADANDTEKRFRYLDEIKASALNMRQLLVNLLDLAKLETGTSLELDCSDITTLIERTVHQNQRLAKASNIDLTYESQYESLFVDMDTDRLQQVMNNLISNSIKYNQENGHVSIMIEQNNDTAQIRVQDSGIGIPEEDLPHIFDRFYRVNNQPHQSIDGTGLGLAICKSIIAQHMGTIEAYSEVGIGTTFIITLPLAKSLQTKSA